MNKIEKVEAYFNNELNSSDKSEFLNEMESDTELKSEYNFQNEIINGIKDARKAELKAMLNRVPITSVSTATTGLYKIFAGSVATILLGTASWYYFTTTEQVELSNQTEVVKDYTENKVAENNISKTEDLQKTTNTPILEEGAKESTEQVTERKEVPSAINTPVLPNSENDFESQSLPEENLEIPSDLSSASINLNSKVDVKIVMKKKYDFHYQFSHSKLVLYGEFEEGLFEVLELNKEDNVEVYLYYKSNFYYILNNTNSISPLKPVSDKNLKLKLEGLR